MCGRVLLLLGLASTVLPAPGWVEDSYQDMMTSFNNIKPDLQRVNDMVGDTKARVLDQWRNLDRQVDEMSDYWGDHLETVGQQMGSRFKKIGSDLEDQMMMAKDRVSDFGTQMGSSFKNSYNRQFGDFDQHLGDFQQRMDQHFGNFGNNLDMFGTGLLSQFDRTFSQNFGSVFGGMGRRATPWWQRDHVCTTREVLEEEEGKGNLEIDVSGGGNFHLQVNQCTERQDTYECVKTVAEQGNINTLKLTYSCCHGYKNLDGQSCSMVEMTPLEETIADLGGSQFLELLVEQGLDKMLHNVTVFVPNDEAIEDFTRELEDLGLGPEQNIVYNIDDGLVNRRKRNIQISDGPELADILAGHMVQGYHNIHEMVQSGLVESANTENNKIRVTVYPTRPDPTVMANCAKVLTRDSPAENGIVHLVDKVIVPAEGTIAQVLSSDLHFGTFMAALQQTDLADLLAEEGDYTVFAPTDSAFAKLDSETREALVGGGGCAGDIIRSHVLSQVVCSGVVDQKVKVTNVAGHEMTLEADEDGNILVGGVKLMMRDKMTSNGVIHVIEDVIVLPAVRSLRDHLKQRHANNLLALLDSAGLTHTLDTMDSITLFAPSEQAISELPVAVVESLADDSKSLEEILLHHVVTESHQSEEMEENSQLETAGGNQLRVNLHKHFGHRQAVAMVQCARIIHTDEKVCGGRVHTIDRVLTPPKGNVVQTLQTTHPKFARLVQLAGMEEELGSGLVTVLAPLDKAFSQLAEEITEQDMAEKVVRNHVIKTPVCCASVLRSSGFLHELRLRSGLGETIALHRSHGGNIYANKAAVVSCDQAASNGVVHSVDRLLLPGDFNNKKKSFWEF